MTHLVTYHLFFVYSIGQQKQDDTFPIFSLTIIRSEGRHVDELVADTSYTQKPQGNL